MNTFASFLAGKPAKPSSDQSQKRKPATLVYGAEENPPIAITIVSGIQHVGVIAIFMIYLSVVR